MINRGNIGPILLHNQLPAQRLVRKEKTPPICIRVSNSGVFLYGNSFAQVRAIPKMTGRGGGGRGKVLLPPINFIFKLLQQHSTVSIWLFEQLGIRIEGKIRVFSLGCLAFFNLAHTFFSQGFDEFMNLVIDDAVEVKQATKTEEEKRRELGATILVKASKLY